MEERNLLTGLLYIDPLYGYQKTADVQFGTGSTSNGPIPLLMDVYQPTDIGLAPVQANRPAIVVQDGGAWTSGDKGNGRVVTPAIFMAQHGYTVFVANYRQTGDNPSTVDPGPWTSLSPSSNSSLLGTLTSVYPGFNVVKVGIEDFATAITYVRNHAATYGIDGSHIAGVGGSAGAINLLDLQYNGNTTAASYRTQANISAVGSMMGDWNKVVAGGAPLFLWNNAQDPLIYYTSDVEPNLHNRLKPASPSNPNGVGIYYEQWMETPMPTDHNVHYDQYPLYDTSDPYMAGVVNDQSELIMDRMRDFLAYHFTPTGPFIVSSNTPPAVDLSVPGGTINNTVSWTGNAAVNIADAAATVADADGGNLASIMVALNSPHAGDVLDANVTGTAITKSFAGNILTLSGSDLIANYQAVLRSVTYNNTAGGPGVSVETVNVTANDGTANSAVAVATININSAPVVDLNGAGGGTGNTSFWLGAGGVAIADAANATVTDDGANLTSMTVTLTSPAAGDVLAATTVGNITTSYSAGTLSLTGSDTLANYQTVLRSITYNNTSGGPGVAVETATVVATDGSLVSAPVTATINMPAPNIVLTVGAGSGTPNFTTSWYNSGSIPIENNIQASVGALSGIGTLQSLTVTLATFYSGDVLSVPILAGVAITSSYSAGTLTLSGSDTLAHYAQELKYINYNNTAGGPGVAQTLATFVAGDGTHTGTPVTATINVNVAGGEVLGNRLFYNNSKYDGGAGSGNAAINANDDLAIASDKTAFKGTGTATFANVSAFTKGITGIMVDLQAGLGSHSAINLTSGDITFKVAPTTFATTTYNQLSNWTAAPTPTAISVRLGAGTGGSDRLEITWATGAIKNTWLEVNVHSGGNTGLSADDVFYFGSEVGDSGTGDTALLAKTDVSDYVAANNNIIGLTTPVWNLVDYSKDGKVDISDSNSAINGVFTLHYMGNPVGPFAPDSGAGAAVPSALAASSTAAAPSATGAISSGLASLLGAAPTVPSWLAGRLQSVLNSPPVTKAIQNALHNPQILHAIDQITASFHAHDDALESLLTELGA